MSLGHFLCLTGYHDWDFGIDKKYGEGACQWCNSNIGLFRQCIRCGKIEIKYHFGGANKRCLWFPPGR